MRFWKRLLYPWGPGPEFRPQLTGRGRWLRAAGLSTLLMGVGLSNSILVMFALFVLFLVWVSRRLSYHNLENIAYSRATPPAVFVRERFEVKFMLSGAGRRLAGFDLEVTDALIHEHMDNPATFGCLEPGAEVSQVQTTSLARRGVYPAFPFRLESLFPFGLASRAMIGVCRTPITVYPRPRLTAQALNVLQTGLGHGDSRREAGRGSFGEFRSMREYRPGDDARCVSWPFSARFQRLIVKETERPAPCRARVVFHSWVTPGMFVGQKSFERALQLLSGLFGWLYEQSVTADFTADFMEWRRVSIGHDPESLREAVTRLASARMIRQADEPGLRAAVLSEGAPADIMIVVSNTPARFWARHVPPAGIPVCCLDNSGGVWSASARAGEAV